MNHDLNPRSTNGHGDYERRDIGVAGVLYFLLGLLVAGGIAHFIVQGVYHYLDNRYETRSAAGQPAGHECSLGHPPHSAAIQRRLSKISAGSISRSQLEINERTELNDIRLREENTLSTYG